MYKNYKKCIMGCTDKMDLHLIPKDATRRAEWLRILGKDQSTKCLYACSRHFHPKFIIGKRVTRQAIPIPFVCSEFNHTQTCTSTLESSGSSSEFLENSYINPNVFFPDQFNTNINATSAMRDDDTIGLHTFPHAFLELDYQEGFGEELLEEDKVAENIEVVTAKDNEGIEENLLADGTFMDDNVTEVVQDGHCLEEWLDESFENMSLVLEEHLDENVENMSFVFEEYLNESVEGMSSTRLEDVRVENITEVSMEGNFIEERLDESIPYTDENIEEIPNNRNVLTGRYVQTDPYISSSTPRKWALKKAKDHYLKKYREEKRTNIKLQKENAKLTNELNNFKAKSINFELELYKKNDLSSKLSPMLALCLENSLKNHCRESKACRYDTSVKLVALAVLFLSPVSYRYLKPFYDWPDVRTLQRFVENWPKNPGNFTGSILTKALF